MQSKFNWWLERQVARLEREITTHNVFESKSTPTSNELMELRRLAVIHRFLTSKLNGSHSYQEPKVSAPPDRIRTQEVELRKALAIA